MQHRQLTGKQSAGRFYVNNGIVEKLIKDGNIPEGFSIGRLPEHNIMLGKGKKGKVGNRRGCKHSVESKEKMSCSHTDKEPSNKGKISMVRGQVKVFVSRDEIESRLRDGWKLGGLSVSEDTKRKISERTKGHTWSLESKKRKSDKSKGRVSNTKGRKRMYREGCKYIMVKPEDVPLRLSEGWSLKY